MKRKLKKIKCNVCNNKFSIKKSKLYVVKDQGIGLSLDIKLYNAIDCPNCGCQNILKVRLREVKEK